MQKDPENEVRGGRQASLLDALIQSYTAFVEGLPAPLPALARAHPEFFGERLNTPSPGSVPIPLSLRLPFLFWPLFRRLEDEVFFAIASAGTSLYTGSVLLDHVVDGEVPDPGGFTLLQRAFWARGAAGYRGCFPPDSPFWSLYDDRLERHQIALAREIHAREHPERFTRDLFTASSAGKTGPAFLQVAALAVASGRSDLLEPLEASIHHYGIAMQFVDDLQDWEEDLKNGHLTHLLACTVPLEIWKDEAARAAPETREEIANHALILEHWRLALEAFDESLAAVHTLDCPQWTDLVFMQRTIADQRFQRDIAKQLVVVLKAAVESEGAHPRNSSPVSGETKKIPTRTIEGGLAAILSRQDPRGAWVEFDLPNARGSDAWVTAHIGLKLACLPEKWHAREVRRALTAAVEFLKTQWRHGWGYNARIPVDADTTAHVLLFFAAMGVEAPASTIFALLEHQMEDGGFATYNGRRSPNIAASWCVPAPDITPVVLRALAPYRHRVDVRQAIDRALPNIEKDRLPSGRWPAFWWDLNWYTANAWMNACRDLAVGFPDPHLKDNCRSILDRALLLEVAAGMGHDGLTHRITEELSAAQLPSGLWPIVPALCQPEPGVYRAWEMEVRAILYPEKTGIYSTATILSALAANL